MAVLWIYSSKKEETIGILVTKSMSWATQFKQPEGRACLDLGIADGAG
jgi:hypothetical protein